MSSGKLPFLGLRRSKITILRWDFTCLLHTMYVRVGDVYVNPRGSIYKYLKEVQTIYTRIPSGVSCVCGRKGKARNHKSQRDLRCKKLDVQTREFQKKKGKRYLQYQETIVSPEESDGVKWFTKIKKSKRKLSEITLRRS